MANYSNQEIDELFTTSYEEPKQFLDQNFFELPHTNVNSNQVTFSTINIVKNLAIISDSFLVVDHQVQITNATDTTQLSLKQGVVSLINGLQLGLATNGGGLVNENNFNLLNGYKLLLKSYEWTKQCGQDLLYDKNSAPQALIGFAAEALTAAPQSSASVNSGQFDRIKYLKNNSTQTLAGGTMLTVTFTSYIPLCLIHSSLEALSFPMNNVPLEMTFSFSCAPGSLFQPFQLTDTTLGNTTPTITSMIVGNGNNAAAGTTMRAPYIYYKGVHLMTKAALKYSHAIAKGYKKEIHYVGTQLNYTFLNYSNTNVSHTNIFSGIVRPLRMWCCVFPTGYHSAADSYYNGVSPPILLDNIQVTVNGSNLYNAPIIGKRRVWELFRKNLYKFKDDDAISDVTFADFLTGTYALHVFDLTEIKNNMDFASNTPVLLSLTATAPAGSFDYVYMIEAEQIGVLNISSSNATIVRGQFSS